MTTEPKTLRVQATVDSRSFEVAINMLRRLKTEIQDVAKEANKLGGGGLFGGMSMNRGGVNPQQQAVRMPGAAGGVAQSVANDAKILQSVARAGADAYKTLSSVVRTGTSEQISQLERLKRTAMDLERAYSKLANVRTVPGSRAAENLAGVRSSAGQAAASANAAFDQAWSAYRPIPMPRSQSTMDNQSMPWLAGGINRSTYVPPPPGMTVANAQGGAFSYGGVGNFSLGGIMGGIMGGGAIAAGYNALNTAYVQGVSADIMRANDPMDARVQWARQNQALGGFGNRLRHSASLKMAVAQLDPSSRAAFMGDQVRDKMLQENDIRLGQTGGFGQSVSETGHGISVVAQGIWNRFKTRTGGDEKAAIARDWEQRAENTRAAQEQAQRLTAADITMKQVESVENMRQRMSVRETEVMDTYVNNIDSRLAQQRAYGTSRAQRLGLGSAFTGAEKGAMRVAFGNEVGRGAMGIGEGYVNQFHGGLTNVASIYGAGNQYGQGRSIVSALNGGIGTGGVDVLAGNQLGAYGAGAMQREGADMGAGGAGSMMSGLLAAANGGSIGENMRLARILPQGTAALGNVMSGGVDNYQKGVNMLAAVRAAPGMDVQALDALQKIGPEAMLGMLRSGKISDSLARRGFNIDQVRAYNAEQQRFAFSRYIGTGNYGEVGTAAAGAARAGGAAAYVKGLGIFGTKGGDAQIRHIAKNLGSALHDENVALSEEAGEAMVLRQLESAGLLKAAKGAGAQAAYSKADAAVKKERDVYEGMDEQEIVEKLRGQFGTPGFGKAYAAATKHFDRLGVKAGTGDTNLASEVKSSINALADFAGELRRTVTVMAAARQALGNAKPGPK